MAQLDPSIILQGKGVQLDNPLEVQARVAQLRALNDQSQLHQLQVQKYQQDVDQQRTLADLYKGAVNPDGSLNRQAILSGAAERGLGAQIPGLQKQFTEADKSSADVSKTKAETGALDFKTKKEQLDTAYGAIHSLLADPKGVNHEDVIGTIVGLTRFGIISPDQGAEMVRQVPGDPGRLRPFLVAKGLETQNAAKRLEALTPKFEKIDQGGSIVTGTVDPLTGQFTGGGAIQKSVTPDAQLGAQTTMRGQNMADSRARAAQEQAAQGVTYQTDADGNLVALPTKGIVGQPVQGMAVTDASGKPIMGKSKDASLTEDQGKATGWLVQADNAWKNMQKVMQAAPGAAKPGFGDAVGKLPVVGGLGNFAKNAPRQQFIQASSSLSEALLRAATGAGVNRDEAAQKIQELTPQFGDTDANIKQKMDAIPLYLESLKVRAGPGAKKASAISNSGSQLPADIEALLKKHGG